MAAVVVMMAGLVAQTKPSSAGEWKRDVPMGDPGVDLIITQDATSMTVEYKRGGPAPAPVKLTYKLDGSVNKNTMAGRAGGAATEQVSKAMWASNNIVVITTTGAGEEKRTFSMEGSNLVVETSAPTRSGGAPNVTKGFGDSSMSLLKAARFSLPRVVLVTGLVGAVHAAQGPTLKAPDWIGTATVADTAAVVARSGFSAGFIVSLPSDKEEELARVRATSRLVSERSAFRLWLRSDWKEPDWTKQRLNSQAEVDQALSSLAARTPMSSTVREADSNNVTVIKLGQTSLCNGRLQQMVTEPVQGRNLLKVLSELVHEATGASVPRGFIGSCIGTNQFAEQDVLIGPSVTLEAALNNVVSGFGSSVWVAVESRSGLCSMGILQKGTNGGVCTAAITDNLPQK